MAEDECLKKRLTLLEQRVSTATHFWHKMIESKRHVEAESNGRPLLAAKICFGIEYPKGTDILGVCTEALRLSEVYMNEAKDQLRFATNYVRRIKAFLRGLVHKACDKHEETPKQLQLFIDDRCMACRERINFKVYYLLRSSNGTFGVYRTWPCLDANTSVLECVQLCDVCMVDLKSLCTKQELVFKRQMLAVADQVIGVLPRHIGPFASMVSEYAQDITRNVCIPCEEPD